MLKEIIENTILRKRPEQLVIRTYGNYNDFDIQEGIYNDAAKEYRIYTASNSYPTVRSAKAFIAFINEELKRRENKSGKFATVHLTLNGGDFTADCNFMRGLCKYDRLQSEGYKILEEIKDDEVEHEEFLHILRQLKPYIIDFNDVYKACSKIKLLRNSKVTSQPEFNEGGEKESTFTCVYRLENGEENDFKLPSSFNVYIPFSKAGEKKYIYEIELIYSLDNCGGLTISFKIPDWETNEEKAIFDEAEDIKKGVESAEELLILSDF